MEPYMSEQNTKQRRQRLDVSVFETVMQSGNVAARMALTRQLCDLLNAPGSDSEECREATTCDCQAGL